MLRFVVLAWVLLRASPSAAADFAAAPALAPVVDATSPNRSAAEYAAGTPGHSGERAWLVCRNPSVRRCVLLREPAACGDAEAPGVLEARLSPPIGPADLDAAMAACRARLPR